MTSRATLPLPPVSPVLSVSPGRGELPPQFLAAVELDRFLGDPADPAGRFSFREAIELDESESYPEAATSLLDAWGLPAYYVPAGIRGGRLASFEELLALTRMVARRDLTVAIAHAKTVLGAVSVWLAGNAEQQDRLAELILDGRQIALGLTEREHGSDLLGTELQAVRGAASYRLTGEKWLINNATRSAALTVFARTESAGGPRGFSCFLVEKGDCAPGSYRHLPKIRTHGIRGADISGIRFDGTEVSAKSLIGLPGSGFESVLRGFQMTRTLCAALSLGAADTALRTAFGFAGTRRMYGEPVAAIPHVQRTLAQGFADLLICDCLALAAARGLHAASDQLSVGAAVVKAFVPAAVDDLLHELSLVLGARGYLREGHDWGIFQKLKRDHAIVGIFDGSSVVNLRAIGLQLSQLGRGRASAEGRGDGEIWQRLERTLRLDLPLPPLDLSRLELSNHGRDEILRGVDLCLARLSGGGEAVGRIRARVEVLQGEIVALRRAATAATAGQPGAAAYGDKSAARLELARRYCVLHAAAVCLEVWIFNRDRLDDWFEEGEWLVACLDRLLVPRDRAWRTGGARSYAALYGRLAALAAENRLFSLVPFPLSDLSAEKGSNREHI